MSKYQFNPDQEQWKAIPDFPGYEISDQGRVRSYWRPAQPMTGYKWVLVDIPQRILRQSISRGYLRVELVKNGQRKTMRVHRLMLLVFVGPCPAGYEARHSNGCRTKNTLNNLSWSTHKENLADRKIHGTDPIGERCGRTKLTESQVKHIRSIHDLSPSQIGKMFNVDASTIRKILIGENWKHLL